MTTQSKLIISYLLSIFSGICYISAAFIIIASSIYLSWAAVVLLSFIIATGVASKKCANIIRHYTYRNISNLEITIQLSDYILQIQHTQPGVLQQLLELDGSENKAAKIKLIKQQHNLTYDLNVLQAIEKIIKQFNFMCLQSGYFTSIDLSVSYNSESLIFKELIINARKSAYQKLGISPPESPHIANEAQISNNSLNPSILNIYRNQYANGGGSNTILQQPRLRLNLQEHYLEMQKQKHSGDTPSPAA